MDSSQEREYNHVFKSRLNRVFLFIRNNSVIIIGESNVGKSALVSRFINDKFDAILKPTIGADFAKKYITVGFKYGKFFPLN
jgi:GTPase SAR1 family protein